MDGKNQEVLMEELKKQRQIIEDANSRIGQILRDMEHADRDSMDWISVRKAAELVDVNVASIYRKINKGQLNRKCIGAKTFVSKSQLLSINDINIIA